MGIYNSVLHPLFLICSLNQWYSMSKCLVCSAKHGFSAILLQARGYFVRCGGMIFIEYSEIDSYALGVKRLLWWLHIR
jgi:hypothetical protein